MGENRCDGDGVRVRTVTIVPSCLVKRASIISLEYRVVFDMVSLMKEARAGKVDGDGVLVVSHKK